MTTVINPAHLCAYAYEILLDDVRTSMTISITVPPDIAPALVTVEHDDPITWIAVGIPDELPFLAGRLYETATSISCARKPPGLVVRLGKDHDSQWRILIRDFISPARQVIDPQSAFVLSLSYRSQNMEQPSRLFLESSVRARFPPAVAHCARFLSNTDPGFGLFVEELKTVARNYRDAQCCARIGLLGVREKISVATAIEYLSLGIESSGGHECLLILGCLLSPLEKPPGTFKNASESWKLLNRVPDHPRSKLARAKLLAVGAGCSQNRRLARELMIEARKADPNLPVIEGLDDESLMDADAEVAGGWSFTGIGIAGLCLAVAILVWRFVRSNRQT
jgi:hypothetical protein